MRVALFPHHRLPAAAYEDPAGPPWLTALPCDSLPATTHIGRQRRDFWRLVAPQKPRLQDSYDLAEHAGAVSPMQSPGTCTQIDVR